MRRLPLALLLLVPLLLAAGPPRPTLPTLEAADEAKVLAGKIAMTTTFDGAGGGFVTGVIEIDASPEAIWPILTNFEALPEATPSIKTVDRYTDADQGGGLRVIDVGYMIKVAWVEVRYHVHHDYYPAEQYLVWELDASKPNEIDATFGSFSTWPGSSAGKTRFLYQTRVDTGRSIPKWVEEDLTESSLKKYMRFVKQKAEGK